MHLPLKLAKHCLEVFTPTITFKSDLYLVVVVVGAWLYPCACAAASHAVLSCFPAQRTAQVQCLTAWKLLRQLRKWSSMATRPQPLGMEPEGSADLLHGPEGARGSG